MKQHIKGVIIASIIALGAVFLLSLLMSSQLVLTQDVVIKKPQSEVYAYLKQANNLSNWWKDLQGVDVEQKDSLTLQFSGHDKGLYQLEFTYLDNANGLEIKYFEEGENKAIIKMQASAAGEETVLHMHQFWDLGVNPIAKLMANKSKEENEQKMYEDLYRLKLILEAK